MSVQSNIAAALLRVVTAINAVNTKTGTLSSLTTTDKTNLVAALNELKAASSSINDAANATTSTWSSTKIQTQINAAITALINGADGANDTLQELANRITALAQADAGLLSFTQAQTLSVGEQQQGCSNLGVGDPAHNYVTAIESNLNAGL